MRFAAIDPNLYSWGDCQHSIHCRPAHDQLGRLPAGPKARWLGAAAARAAGLPESPALVAAATTDSIGGRWTVASMTSVARIAERETALLRQLIVTSLAAALPVVAVALFILRQQRQAGALHERLHTAHQLATMREKTDAMVENAPLGILGIADDGAVVIANRFLTGRLGPIQIGKRWEEAFAPGARPGAGRLRALLESARADPTGKVEARGVDLLAPEAGDFDVRAVLLHHGSEDVRLLALIEDRSQVRSLEQQLIRTEKILTAGVLSAGLAHEIGPGLLSGPGDSPGAGSARHCPGQGARPSGLEAHQQGRLALRLDRARRGAVRAWTRARRVCRPGGLRPMSFTKPGRSTDASVARCPRSNAG